MFGRLLSFEPDAIGVTVKFEHKEGRISFITDRIVRVYSSMEEKHRPSRAVVQEPKKVDFQARQQKEFITIKTKKLLVRVRDEFQVDFLTPDGRMISEQTARTTKKQEITAQQAMSCQKSSQIIHLKLCVCFIQRSISMDLAIRLAFLIKEATLMKCGIATFQIRIQIFSQVFISLFRSLFQCVLILHMEFFLTIRQSLILIWERKRQSAIILQQTAAI